MDQKPEVFRASLLRRVGLTVAAVWCGGTGLALAVGRGFFDGMAMVTLIIAGVLALGSAAALWLRVDLAPDALRVRKLFQLPGEYRWTELAFFKFTVVSGAEMVLDNFKIYDREGRLIVQFGDMRHPSRLRAALGARLSERA